jgi:hypothetical protein
MFYNCTGIKLSVERTEEYSKEYRIPKSDTGTTATDALTNMFANTGGTFTGTPEINTVYYRIPTKVYYTITYFTEYSIAPASKTVTVNEGESYILTANDLSIMNVDGYKFKGWAINGTPVSVGDTISADTVLTAMWEIVPTTSDKDFLLYHMFSNIIARALSTTGSTTEFMLLSADGYILIDKNGLNLVPKEVN